MCQSVKWQKKLFTPWPTLLLTVWKLSCGKTSLLSSTPPYFSCRRGTVMSFVFFDVSFQIVVSPTASGGKCLVPILNFIMESTSNLSLNTAKCHNLISCLHINLTEHHPKQSGAPQWGTQCYLPITLQMGCETHRALNVCRLADPSPASRAS